MKYTVVIREPVADSMRQVLEHQLMERFGLNGEQAQRLSARRSGRLMKPTGRARAELLLSMFQAVSANVSLEEVRDETNLISEPFQGVAPPPRQVVPAPVSAAPDDAPLAPSNPQPSVSQDMADLRASAIWPEVKFSEDSVASVPRPSAFGADPFAAATSDPFAPLAAADDWRTPPAAPVLDMGEFTPGSLFAPEPTAPGTPEVPAAQGSPAPGPFAAAANDPFGSLPGTPASAGMASAGMGGGAAIMTAPEVAPADVWSDFTGALSMPAAATPESTPDVQLRPLDSVVVTPLADPLASASERRSSLSRRMAVGALVPLGVSSALTLGVLALTLPNLQGQLVKRNAQAVAVAVGTNLDPSRSQSIPTQLQALVTSSSVGFVQIELRDGTRYFRSQTPELDDLLNPEISNWLIENPKQSTFTRTVNPAAIYRQMADELKSVGAGTANDTLKLDKLAADPANQRSTRVNYIVQKISVLEQDGVRSVTTNPVDSENTNLLYSVAVGVENAEQAATLRNTLLLVLFVALLALGLAAYLAVRAAQRVVEPIERLVRVADAISMGDLSRPVQPERNDEIGDLAQALERMRLSLDSAMERLRRRKQRG
ncbi:HAMP domain-containing protein [Deinococcus knuensis]|uniref:histidine kinase n=1 Tax=Deinococcus knuensis TaxID=1837380 RepID=A0ABQ2SA37_9DEIO|nr:HAMP domain-containing protein [Deinococcus knuensis]GGS13165.1 HAMP domain-containing protein [Deinococcus knuensis]